MASKNAFSKVKKDKVSKSEASSFSASNTTNALALPSKWEKRGAWGAFILVLLACATWVMFHAYLVDTVTVRLCNDADINIPPAMRMPVFLSEIAFDGYTWNRHAEKIGENGQWRVRHTDFDNAPAGREVHWNSGFAWYLRALGEGYRAFTGDSLRNSIFRMSIWANPILLLLAIGIFSTLSARRFGPLCGSVIAIGMLAVPTFYEGFMPAYPDHHGLIAFTLLGLLFGIAWAGAGWVQVPEGKDFAAPHSLAQARHGMIFSAICGAAGLWVSAFSEAAVLATIGVGAIVSVFFYGRNQGKATEFQYHPSLWKLWALWGAGGSLFFYLLEYFPFDMGVRMEVNHPLYAIAWLGGGWLIAIITLWILGIGKKENAFPWKQVILPILACLALPTLIALGGNEVYAAKDPFMMRLYKNIAELLPLLKRIEMGGLTWQIAFGWFPVFLLVAVVLQFIPRVGRGTKAVLIFLSIPILLVTGMQFYQVRWGMLAGPLYIALMGIAIPQVWRLVPRDRVSLSLATVVLAGFAYLFVVPSFNNSFLNSWAQYSNGPKISISSGQGLALLHRQMAFSIRESAGGQPVVLLSSPNSSCLLSALGGFRTVGTLYWENSSGLKAAADGLNAQSDEEALRFIQKHGITHISLMTWENFIEPFFYILYPNPVPGKSFVNSFGKRLLGDKRLPPWLRPLIFPPNALTQGLKQQVLMLQVAQDQSLNDAKVHLARFIRLVEGNPVAAEVSLKQILDVAPDNVYAHAELANLCFDSRRYQEAVDETLKAMANAAPEIRANLLTMMTSALNQAQQQTLALKLQQSANELSPK